MVNVPANVKIVGAAARHYPDADRLDGFFTDAWGRRLMFPESERFLVLVLAVPMGRDVEDVNLTRPCPPGISANLA